MSLSINDSPLPPRSARYMPQLDGLRALAVFAVVWSHWMPEYSGGLPWGHFGVQLFFVLSGFLITGILLREKPNPGDSRVPVLKQFFIRRALRIIPAYSTILAIAWLMDFNDTRATILWHATYTTSIYLWLTKAFSPLSHFWSLSVEEQFYLIWPWVVLWSSPQMLLRIVITMMIATPVFQIVMQWLGPEIRPTALELLHLPQISSSLPWLSSETEPTVLMPAAADALGAGALVGLAEYCQDWKQTFRRVQMLVCLPVFWILQSDSCFRGVGLPGSAESIRETAMVVTFSLIVSQASAGYRGPVGWLLSRPLLIGIGRISYGIYLIHNLTPHLVRGFFDWCSVGAEGLDGLHPGWRFILLWFTTLLLAMLSWVIVERPCLQLKDRWKRENVSAQ